MLKRHVLYIVAAILTVVLVAVACFNFGTIKTFTRISSPDSSREPTVPEKEEALKCKYTIDDYNDIVQSITRVLEFIQLYWTELTLDTAVGTRCLQGQLQVILESIALPNKIRMQLQQMLTNVTDTTDNLVKHFVDKMIEKDQSPAGKERLQKNLKWIENGLLWEMPAAGDWRKTDDLDLKRYDVVDGGSLSFADSNFSDGCIGAVFDNCDVPADCFTAFLGQRYSEYLIAHAIFFLIFAKKKNCFNDQEYMAKITKVGHPDDILASFCAKMFVEAQLIDMNGFHTMQRDLFSEQTLVCSMAGFRQFLHPSWLRTTLSWQSNGTLGCFEVPKPKNYKVKTFEEVYGFQKENTRVKRYDHLIAAGSQSCSAHFTGIATGSIGMHLRYLIESCSQTLFEADGDNSR